QEAGFLQALHDIGLRLTLPGALALQGRGGGSGAAVLDFSLGFNGNRRQFLKAAVLLDVVSPETRLRLEPGELGGCGGGFGLLHVNEGRNPFPGTSVDPPAIEMEVEVRGRTVGVGAVEADKVHFPILDPDTTDELADGLRIDGGDVEDE